MNTISKKAGSDQENHTEDYYLYNLVEPKSAWQ
jgi:hypothetical protein